MEPIPTIYSTAQMKTCLQPSWVTRKPPKPLSILPDQLQEFHQVDQIKSLEDLDEAHAPPGYLYHKVENEYAAYYKMCFKKSPKVIRTIRIDKLLRVSLERDGVLLSLTTIRLTSVLSVSSYQNLVLALTYL